MFRSVILSGQNALKTAFLMNGGATMAFTCFLRKLSMATQVQSAVFASALVVFVIGVLAITVASGLTYLSQWFYAHSEPWKRKIGHVLNFLTIALGLASYGFFHLAPGQSGHTKAFVGFA